MASYYRRMKPYLGTFVEIGIDPTYSNCEGLTNDAFEKIKNIHDKLSFQDSKSELSYLNNSNGKTVSLSRISVQVIKLAKLMTRSSKNYFNCTVGNCFTENDVEGTSTKKLLIGTSDDIHIHGNAVRLNRNITLILDGIAKGYAVDMAIKELKKGGVRFGWVNAGGDLRVFGDMEWPVYINNMKGDTQEVVYLKDAAIATSGVSNELSDRFSSRFISTSNNKLQNGVWSVISKTTWRADALTKVAANASFCEREALVEKLGGKLVNLQLGNAL